MIELWDDRAKQVIPNTGISIESENARLRNDIEVMRNALKYYSEECDTGCFADWGERAKIALAAIEAAKDGKA